MKISMKVLAGLTALLFAGCAGGPVPYRHINFQDGVHDGEILGIAIHELEISPEKDNFAPKPRFVNNRLTRCLKNHKLVVFPSEKMFNHSEFYVIVDSQTGDVVKSGRMSPQKNSTVLMIEHIDGCYE